MKSLFSKNSLFLLLAAFIWGIAFVAQTVGMDYIGPFTFGGIRYLLGFLVLLPAVFFRCRKDRSILKNPVRKKSLLLGGLCCGIFLFAASSLQQIALITAPAGKTGFITALYIVLVPVFNLLLFRKKASRFVWIAVLLAVFGLYLLCGGGGFSMTMDELLTFLCAVLFAFHILVIDHFVREADPVGLSCLQFLTAGILCLIAMGIAGERPTLSDVAAAWLPLLYAGAGSCGLAYTFQIIGQKGTDPATASVLLSLESCFSVLAGFVLLHQSLTPMELIGCALMFAAVLLAQVQPKAVNEQKEDIASQQCPR